MKWLSLDPGLLNCGWCIGRYVDRITGPVTEIVAGGCFNQPKAPKKRNIKSAADDFDRAAKLSVKIGKLIDDYKPEVICIESMSLPRNSSTAGKLGRAYGVISALAALSRLPVVAISPQEVKEGTLGSRSGSKSEMRGALTKAYGSETIDTLVSGLAKQLHEHPIDALAVLHASVESVVFKIGGK